MLVSCRTPSLEVQGNLSSCPYPLVILPGAYTPCSTILQLIRDCRPPHPVKAVVYREPSQKTVIIIFTVVRNLSLKLFRIDGLVTLCTCIWDILGLDLGMVASYPDCLQYFCSSVQRQSPEICWHCVLSDPFLVTIYNYAFISLLFQIDTSLLNDPRINHSVKNRAFNAILF